MHRNYALASLAAGALLLVCITADRPHGIPLGDVRLSSITGQETGTIGYTTNCGRSKSNLGTGQVYALNCPNPPAAGGNAPQCVACQGGDYNGGGSTDTGEGGWVKSSGFDCSFYWKKVGTCQADGSCQFPATQQFCAGVMDAYRTQYPPG